MESRQSDTMRYFRLKPLRAARVSEISESTAASSVPPEERVDFHIGNPLQDPRLSSAYLRIALGIGIQHEELRDDDQEALLQYLGWAETDKPALDLLIRIIRKSAPYMPRGGYKRTEPSPVVKALSSWLENQAEPLSYDLGQQSGRREVILASGGIEETLRILFHALSSYLVLTPANVLLYGTAPSAARSFPGLRFEELPPDESVLLERVRHVASSVGEHPCFLVLGQTPGEETRRTLHAVSLQSPLFFVEANDAPNQFSLAREAKLTHRVLRILTPGIFSPRLSGLSTVFVAGSAELLRALEAVHFQLKGTPSASEVEFLSFILEHDLIAESPGEGQCDVTLTSFFEGFGFGGAAGEMVPYYAAAAERRLGALIGKRAAATKRILEMIEARAERLSRRVRVPTASRVFDEAALIDTQEFVGRLTSYLDSPERQKALLQGYLSAFVRHHPEYRASDCVVVSGSSRTSLGLLGFHCGITDVVTPDLSWSYEHCFPAIHAVPLTPSFELDVDEIVRVVDAKIANDVNWPRHGAVVLNNPHNATGRVFDERSIRTLLCRLLERDVFVIDDLSYQNVVPRDEMPEVKTLRQTADELVRLGATTLDRAERVITVQSISKTDCLAGARLSVVEIRDRELLARFRELTAAIRPNIAAVAISYLFYRQGIDPVRAYWRLRNKLFQERNSALLEAVKTVPAESNPFGLTITPPSGSMYPLLTISRLPPGLSLDWLASFLARQGIGMLPLATFARTEQGFEIARNSFRLTLGGTDGAAALLGKTHRVLIDLNLIVGEEASRYNRKTLSPRGLEKTRPRVDALRKRWEPLEAQIVELCVNDRQLRRFFADRWNEAAREWGQFGEEYLPERLAQFRRRLFDRAALADELVRSAARDGGKILARTLEREFYKDDIARRREAFRLRLYDRTVHPTQMYSIKAGRKFERIIAAMIRDEPVPPEWAEEAARELAREYLGLNVAINSHDETEEIILDLDALIAAEQYAQAFTDTDLPVFLSFWGDWDGSNRPSGQGHQLAASVIMENVSRMTRILNLLLRFEGTAKTDPGLLRDLRTLRRRGRRFAGLLREIIALTHQLEKRYKGMLPFSVKPDALRRIGMAMHLTRDPLKSLWQHNDRLERNMLELRSQRRDMLEYYFRLNKKLRKHLHDSIPAILAHAGHRQLLLEAALYRDLLQRVIVTPRVQQSQITAKDQFAIDTTVYNLFEINAIAAQYGNPGLVLALQVSLSTKAEALIALDRKMVARRDRVLRDHPGIDLPAVSVIPLFEDLDSVRGISGYLNKVWDHALQSRRGSQDARERFAEIVTEVFVAGSDLSQQVSQAAAAALYKQAKHDVMVWLAERGLADRVRMKIGSGEPMQRQGAYYSPVAGSPAFSCSPEAERRIDSCLPAAARRSARHAVTPLLGVLSDGDLRTYQSTVSEKLRFLPADELANILFHVREAQAHHRNGLIRASESLSDNRLQTHNRRSREMERLTTGPREPVFSDFLPMVTECFRQILYGREEDVVGLHVIAYFVGRSMPQLRDRPTNRRSLGAGAERGQKILASIAEIVPLSHQGSLLRAIAHNHALTIVLGVTQLTVGLFRALDRYGQKAFAEGEKSAVVADRLLPHLPVHEILHSVRIFQDPSGEHLRRIEPAFAAGNSAFVALREDIDAQRVFLPLMQRELLRRHGLEVEDFFAGCSIIPDLLPTLRPDLAVLLQPDLLNTNIDVFLQGASGPVSSDWLNEVKKLLSLPEEIRFWRARIWEILEESVFQRVQSFTELAAALCSLSGGQKGSGAPAAPRNTRLSPAVTGFFRSARTDSEMRSFLAGAIEYLSSVSERDVEVPVSIVRAMNEVERIAVIEEHVLPPEKQDLLRFYALQAARLAGENG